MLRTPGTLARRPRVLGVPGDLGRQGGPERLQLERQHSCAACLGGAGQAIAYRIGKNGTGDIGRKATSAPHKDCPFKDDFNEGDIVDYERLVAKYGTVHRAQLRTEGTEGVQVTSYI